MEFFVSGKIDELITYLPKVQEGSVWPKLKTKISKADYLGRQAKHNLPFYYSSPGFLVDLCHTNLYAEYISKLMFFTS